uniref:Uncharacterized protein n=1 Tax=Meloidogyne enterolobii TaxID=390850 RepID=A0A6V7TQL5_MELEN|nr:unnamed protein product [Meloidogyne enterolobii]
MFSLINLKLLFKNNYLIFIFYSLINSVYNWSEQDEAKRIAQIKEDEKRIFEFQTGQKLPPNLIINQDIPQNLFSQNEYFQKQQNLLIEERQKFSLITKQNESYQGVFTSKDFQQINWCFYCASPLNILSEKMQRVVKNLLSVRRAQFPSSEAITRECTNPKNLDLLPRQTCSGYSHCQTLVLTDHNAGNSFILRGCAERFGAVDPEVLAKRKDNSCQRLHDQVDIQECICEKRKYCYSGIERIWTTKYTEIENWKGPLIQINFEKYNFNTLALNNSFRENNRYFYLFFILLYILYI